MELAAEELGRADARVVLRRLAGSGLVVVPRPKTETARCFRGLFVGEEVESAAAEAMTWPSGTAFLRTPRSDALADSAARPLRHTRAVREAPGAAEVEARAGHERQHRLVVVVTIQKLPRKCSCFFPKIGKKRRGEPLACELLSRSRRKPREGSRKRSLLCTEREERE